MNRTVGYRDEAMFKVQSPLKNLIFCSQVNPRCPKTSEPSCLTCQSSEITTVISNKKMSKT